MNLELAYLSGVIHGDGWLGQTIGLNTSDRDFCEAFAAAASIVSGRMVRCRPHSAGQKKYNSTCGHSYWTARSGNRTGVFDCVCEFLPQSVGEIGQWLRGFFDSEGNAHFGKLPRGRDSWNRSIELFNSNTETISLALLRLNQLEIIARVYECKKSNGHLGSKIVYRITLNASLENFSRFRDLVGSSIARKRTAIEQMCETYCSREHLRSISLAMQAKGAAMKREKMQNETIPRVLRAIADRMAAGLPVTIEACASIPGHSSARCHLKHSEMVQKAKGLL